MHIYFAHPVPDYNTDFEVDCLRLIKKRFPKDRILNPNKRAYDQSYKLFGMAFFVKLVQACGALVYVPFRDGRVGAGVYEEAKNAMLDGHPVYRLYRRRITEVDVKDIAPLSINETRRRNKRLAKRK